MRKLFAVLRGPTVINGFILLVGGAVGFVASEYLNFSSDYRAIIDREISEIQSGTQQVQQSLVTLAMVARGEVEISRDIVKKFDADIINLHERTSTIAGLLPETAEAFKTYKTAMLDLSKSVGKLKGPETSRAFVESISRWNVAKNRFDEKVEVARTTYRVVPDILVFETALQ